MGNGLIESDLYLSERMFNEVCHSGFQVGFKAVAEEDRQLLNHQGPAVQGPDPFLGNPLGG